MSRFRAPGARASDARAHRVPDPGRAGGAPGHGRPRAGGRWAHAAGVVAFGLALLLGPAAAGAQAPAAEGYDVVILHGRVIDPETGLDAVRNVGLTGGRIAAVTEQAIAGKRTIDATGLIVAPGFIDMHEHGQNPVAYSFEVRDGVTTSLELEIGVPDIDSWYGERAGKTIVNYGATVSHPRVRGVVMHDPGTFLPTGPAAHRAATPAEERAIMAGIEKGLERGGLGVGFGLQYTPAASHEEILEAFRVAARHHAPAHVHLRYMGLAEPDNSIVALQEVLADAEATGAPLHVVHIHSMGLAATPILLKMIGDARRHGVDVTTEAYPYTAGETEIQSAIFDPGWQQVLGIGYHDLEWPKTGERLTAATFAKYRKQGGAVILHFIPEADMRAAITSPLTAIASDGSLEPDSTGHPRATGTYARVLGRFVREWKLLDWKTALAKMTIMPAERVATRDPAMKRKGRVQVGADADITVFDPKTVLDRSTYAHPAVPSAGIEYVLVNGVPVVVKGELEPGVFPGQPVRAPIEAPAAAAAGSLPGAVVAGIDSIVEAPLGEGRIAGASVAVGRAGRLVFAKGYGLADRENAVAVTPASVFEVGSVTKQFTATSILQLVAQGKVGLDDELTKYLPDYPEQGHHVTIRELLHHTSGIKSYTSLKRFGAEMTRDLPHDSLVAMFDTVAFDFDPGQEMRYDNSGFFLLGLVVEKASGESFADYIRDHIFRPLGMTGTRYCDWQELIPHRAHGYDSTKDGLRGTHYLSMALPYAAGSLCATAPDLVAWNLALHGGRVLAPAQYATMTSPGHLADGTPLRYGTGIALGDVAGRRSIGHGGDINGFASFSTFFPDDSTAVVVLLNTEGPTRPDALAERIAERVLGPAPAHRTLAAPADLSAFSGSYVPITSPKDTLRISAAADGGLQVETVRRGQVPGAEPVEPHGLAYLGDDTWADGGRRFTFRTRAGSREVVVDQVYGLRIYRKE